MIRAHDVSECLPGPPIPAPDHENRFGTLIQFFQPAYTNIASNMNENVGSSVLVRRSTCTTGTGTCTPTSVSARVLLSFLLLLILGPNEHKLLTLASDPNVPHAHAGKRQPFAPGDPNVSLDRKAVGIVLWEAIPDHNPRARKHQRPWPCRSGGPRPTRCGMGSDIGFRSLRRHGAEDI